jgi:hypothetical protein
MSRRPGPATPARYELRVDGHLGQHWSAWFGNLDLAHKDDGTTSLAGTIADQAELHGMLTKIRDLGITLVSLTVVDRPDNHQPTDTNTK